jgi:hypothetical protein
MIPPAMMSGQPEFVITMKMAATAVRTFSIASFRVDSQIDRIDASPRRKRTSIGSVRVRAHALNGHGAIGPSDFGEMFIDNTRASPIAVRRREAQLDLVYRLRSAQHPRANLLKFRHQRVGISPSHRRGVYLRA